MEDNSGNPVYIKEIKGRQFMLRGNTMDEYVAKEGCYNHVNFEPSDVWLDIGANIGVFPVHHAHQVKEIYSFEPEGNNLYLLYENLQLNHIANCTVRAKAVVWDDRLTADFYINLKKNKGAHSMTPTRGRQLVQVPCVNINHLISRLKPNKIKIDIEGGEYELIKAIKDFSGIKEIVFEYHTTVLKDVTGVKLSELYTLLGKYYDVSGKSPEALAGNWYTIIHCIKK